MNLSVSVLLKLCLISTNSDSLTIDIIDNTKDVMIKPKRRSPRHKIKLYTFNKIKFLLL